MKIRNILISGLISGLVMGIALFLTGAIASSIIYGPQFAPPGKFEQEQINAWYFLWTKLVIGGLFGIFFAFIFSKLPLSEGGGAVLNGLLYGFLLWLIISTWNLSHPLVYGSLELQSQLFWLIYTLGGFLAFGATLGFIYKRMVTRRIS